MPKIFIADDKNTNFKALKSAFEQLIPGCELAHACDGEEIVTMVGREKPDVVLMDIVMPVKNGIDATKEIRKKYTADQLPIIAMTAQDLLTSRDVVMAAGCNDYFTKPFKILELVKSVKEHLTSTQQSPNP